MPRAEYHEHPAISFHKLRDFARSPLFFYRKHILKCIPDGDSDSFAFGRAAHARILEGVDGFLRDFIQCPEEFVTKGGAVSEAKAAKEWQATVAPRVPLSPRDCSLIELLAHRVRGNPFATQLLAGGQPEVERFVTHDGTGLELKACADWLDGATVVDLKTTQSLDTFTEDSQRYGYDGQMAFYRARFGARDVPLLVVEKNEPYRVAVYRFTERRLAHAHQQNETLLAQLAKCREDDHWPGDPDSVIEIDLPQTAA